jgi:cell division protease FtsH
LEENKDKLDLLAEKLLAVEVLFKEDLVEIFGERPWNTAEEIEVERPEGTIEIETISESDSEETTPTEAVTTSENPEENSNDSEQKEEI